MPRPIGPGYGYNPAVSMASESATEDGTVTAYVTDPEYGS